jgi:tetratricopeptide (TPR) repeat protein
MVTTSSPPVVQVSSTARSVFERRAFLVLGAIALIYAFLGGLATVGDPDLGWHLATGRWVAQHHHVFTNDVFSYTVAGTPAIYPPGGGLILYGVYLLGGYALLSLLSAAACAGTVSLLLRRGSTVTAAIAIVAIPFIAFRSVPRAELFAVVLFAAYVSLLWQNYQTARAPLWLLPLLMVIWVNVHLSFFSGIGLLVAFAGLDVLELPFAGERRIQAWQRLQRELPWFAGAVAATLLNPWGWKFYPALVDYTRTVSTLYINEWAPLHWNWISPLTSFSLRNTSDLFHVLFLVILLGIVAAIVERRLGAAILLLGAGYEATRHVRMVALASCIVVVVAGAVLTSTLPWFRAHIRNPRTRSVLAVAAMVLFASLAVVRSADLITNYHYLAERNLSTFGIGLSQWFPRGGAEFIRQHGLPGEVLNTFNEGGYTLFTLGPERRDYIDGRGVPFGAAFAQHGSELLSTPLDSPLWQQEADHYGIRTILFPLTLDEISLERLKSDCKSRQWRPVYLDETSIVLLRRTPETEDLIRRLQVDCATAPLPREELPLSGANFERYIDAARVLSALGRNAEALGAADQAMTIFPDNAHARWYRGQFLYRLGRHAEAESEWQRALALAPREVTPWGSLPDFEAVVWSSLAQLYGRQQRSTDAERALQKVAALASDSAMKAQAYVDLGALHLASGEMGAAEQQWEAALALAPKDGSLWLSLADAYQRDKRYPQAIHATQQAIQFASDPTVKSRALLRFALLQLMGRQPRQALQSLNDATNTAPADLLSAGGPRSFSFDVAQGRAAAWVQLGDLKQATAFEEEAVRLDPNAPDAWSHLAKLYQRQGRTVDQQAALQKGNAVVNSSAR